MSQIKQPPAARKPSSTRVPRALALCLGLGGADLALLNVWVFPGLLNRANETDVSASRRAGGETSARPATAQRTPQPGAANAAAATARPSALENSAAAPKAASASTPAPPDIAAAPTRPVEDAPPSAAAQADHASAAPQPQPNMLPTQNEATGEDAWETPAHSVVVFKLGSASVGSQAMETVAEVAVEAATTDLLVLLAGHADPPGSPAFNLRLSEQRAQSVAAALVEAGVPEGRIRVRGYGEGHPSADGRDRRVEVRFGGAQ